MHTTQQETRVRHVGGRVCVVLEGHVAIVVEAQQRVTPCN